jgi:hypothetical protein
VRQLRACDAEGVPRAPGATRNLSAPAREDRVNGRTGSFQNRFYGENDGLICPTRSGPSSSHSKSVRESHRTCPSHGCHGHAAIGPVVTPGRDPRRRQAVRMNAGRWPMLAVRGAGSFSSTIAPAARWLAHSNRSKRCPSGVLATSVAPVAQNLLADSDCAKFSSLTRADGVRIWQVVVGIRRT